MLYGLVILSLLISLAAQIHVKSSFRKYSQVRNERGMTGAEAARQLLLDHGITDVGIQQIAGSLTDHYDPRTNICSTGSYLLVLIGILVSGRYGNALGYNLITLGIVFFLAVLFFQLVTLPVEFNASGRAVRSLRETGILNTEEQAGVRKVLTAAALTYVAAVAVSLIHLLRLLAIRGRRR